MNISTLNFDIIIQTLSEEIPTNRIYGCYEKTYKSVFKIKHRNKNISTSMTFPGIIIYMISMSYLNDYIIFRTESNEYIFKGNSLGTGKVLREFIITLPAWEFMVSFNNTNWNPSVCTKLIKHPLYKPDSSFSIWEDYDDGEEKWTIELAEYIAKFLSVNNYFIDSKIRMPDSLKAILIKYFAIKHKRENVRAPYTETVPKIKLLLIDFQYFYSFIRFKLNNTRFKNYLKNVKWTRELDYETKEQELYFLSHLNIEAV